MIIKHQQWQTGHPPAERDVDFKSTFTGKKKLMACIPLAWPEEAVLHEGDVLLSINSIEGNICLFIIKITITNN